MSKKIRHQRSLKKRIFYIFLLALITASSFLIYSIFQANSPLFISPLGKNNSDIKKVEKILKDNNILFSQVSVLSDSSYIINIPNNGQVRFSPQKNIDEQVSSLQRILRELTIEGKPFKIIDFRFKEPVLTY